MKRLILVVLLIFLTSCIPEPIPMADEKRGTLVTSDNIEIAYTYNKMNTDKAVILLHMLDRNRHDWNTFTVKLNQNNFSTLAIDFRGHGQSQGDWNTFAAEDFNKIILDIEAAKNFLGQENYSKIYLVGASIGANAALNYAANDTLIKKIVLLSPAAAYRDIVIEDSIKNYQGSILIAVGSKDSVSYSWSLQTIKNFPEKMNLIVYDTNLHGTILLLAYYELNNKIINFLKTN